MTDTNKSEGNPSESMTLQELRELQDTFSDELTKFLTERADLATTNWLFAYGIPSTPAEVRQLIHILYKGTAAVLIADGFMTLTPEKGLATDEERQQKLGLDDDAVKSFLDQVNGSNPDGSGGYL